MKKLIILFFSQTIVLGYTQTAEEFYIIGQKKAFAGSYQEAINTLTKAIELKKDYRDAYYTRGFAKGNLGNYFEAIQDYNKAIAIKNDDMYSYFDRALAKNHLKDFRGAILDLDKVIELDNFTEAYYFRGSANLLLKNWANTLKDFTEFILREDTILHKDTLSLSYRKNPFKIYSDNLLADAYYGRAVANFNLGNENAGCEDLSRAGELGLEKAYKMIEEYCQ